MTISIDVVARLLLGEPASKNDGKSELRYGKRGSLSIDLPNNRWFDHENNEGGGVFDLIKREKGFISDAECFKWLEDEGLKEKDNKGFPPILKTYNYTDEKGALISQVVRYDTTDPNKRFRQRRPDKNGGWIWNLKGVPRVLYRLPELLDGITNERVIYIPEGEKDVESLRSWGLTATCNLGGAKKFYDSFVGCFQGVDVVLIADNDASGKEHVELIASKLSGVARRVRLLDLAQFWPECPAKGDISDWIKAGGTVQQFEQMIDGLADHDQAPSQLNGKKAPKPGIKAKTSTCVFLVRPGDRKDLTDAVEQRLIAVSRELYLRGGLIVRVDYYKMKTWNEEVVETISIEECGDAYLMEVIAEHCSFVKYNARAKGNVSCNPPEWLPRALKQRKSRLGFRLLEGVTNCPYMRANGELVMTAGYNEATGVFFDPRGTEFKPVKENPTKEDALGALDRIKFLFHTFPFIAGKGETKDRNANLSVVLSLLLTTVSRRALDFAPMHAFDAPTAGTGKSMLVDIVSIITTGERAGVIRHTGDHNEFDKTLSATLMRGGPLVAIDNCEEPLKGVLLNQTLTQMITDCRILGKSELIRIRSNATISATGNNLVIEGDLTRRSICCRMDAKEERPELLKFNYDPLKDARENRGELVALVLTILRAYHLAGRPNKETLGGFQEWSNLVRGALLWLGEADPVDTMEDIRKHDPMNSALKAVIMEWGRVWQDEPVTVHDMVDHADQWNKVYINSTWRDAVMTIAGQGKEINRRRFGNWISRNKDKIVSFETEKGAKLQYKITEAGVTNARQKWLLEKIVKKEEDKTLI